MVNNKEKLSKTKYKVNQHRSDECFQEIFPQFAIEDREGHEYHEKPHKLELVHAAEIIYLQNNV